jgi:hypothetical protein
VAHAIHRGGGAAPRADEADSWMLPACAERHSACVTLAGQLLTWGRAEGGRLGHGARPYADAHTPVLVAALKALEIACVALGRAHGVALTRNGRLFGWGAYDAGQRGPPPADGRHDAGVPRPVFVPQLQHALAAGDATVACSRLNIELDGAAGPRKHSPAWARAVDAEGGGRSEPAAAAAAAPAAAAPAAAALAADEGAPTPASAAGAVWRRAGSSFKTRTVGALRQSAAESAAARARAIAEAEAQRQRTMAGWGPGLALWKRALRLLAEERPSLWPAAERYACAGPRPARLDRIAAWYETLVGSTPKAVLEMRSSLDDAPLRVMPRPERKRGCAAPPLPPSPFPLPPATPPPSLPRSPAPARPSPRPLSAPALCLRVRPQV